MQTDIAYRRGIAVKFMYYIEITGIRAEPDEAFGGVFEPLTDSCGEPAEVCGEGAKTAQKY
ncbi:hypothetical protein [Treponema endosymbiont of Eucomonympha sp.]|uniref:hypothetical protein n=1 Tax=Treponema endosymbiont of Eucomonympha sp. TaxID=1580831 RepID=UPI0007510208|nr:hypothetical protein [Treponema endosymbiont of Eucomonympha sp.]